MTNYFAFPQWRQFLQTQEVLTASPFDHDDLGPAPVFLYSEATAPLPCAARSGIWTAYSDVRQLAAHLRFGLLPCDFAIWLARDEWDPAYRRPLTVEDLCRQARAARRDTADCPRMLEIVACLDAALAAGTPAAAWRRTTQACQQFNRRWKSTPSWNFLHRPLRNLDSLARDLAAKGCGDFLDAGLGARLAQPPFDRAAQRDLRALLANLAVG
jgi:hypothetical protein